VYLFKQLIVALTQISHCHNVLACAGNPVVRFAQQHIVPSLRINQGRIVDDDSANENHSKTAKTLKERKAKKHLTNALPDETNGDHLQPTIPGTVENVAQQHDSIVQQLEALSESRPSPMAQRHSTGAPLPPTSGAPMSLGGRTNEYWRNALEEV
jgi:hypothetical protein